MQTVDKVNSDCLDSFHLADPQVWAAGASHLLVRNHAEGQVGAGLELIRVSMPDGKEARLLEISSALPVARVARIVLDQNDGIWLFAT